MARDIAEILDVPDEDWEYEDEHKAYMTPEAEARLTRLHVETMVALQIVLATGEFRPGRHRRATLWGIDWQRDESGQRLTGRFLLLPVFLAGTALIYYS